MPCGILTLARRDQRPADDPTPIRSHQAGSICSLSGLNDAPDDPVEGGKTQSWATAFKAGTKEEGLAISQAGRAGLFLEFGPGTNCGG